jgi:RNA polymerase sigma factor (sigma-70 family)
MFRRPKTEPGSPDQRNNHSAPPTIAPHGSQDLEDFWRRKATEILQLARLVKGPNATQTLSLANEALLKLARIVGELDRKSTNEVRAILITVMRRILVDRARERMAEKRGGGGAPVAIEEAGCRLKSVNLFGKIGNFSAEDYLAVDAATEELKRAEPRQAEVIWCRFWLGMTKEETASALHIGRATVERDESAALKLLEKQLRPEEQ